MRLIASAILACATVLVDTFMMFHQVFWPILVLYFFVLFGISMKQRIEVCAASLQLLSH